MLTNIRAWGNSQGLCIPKEMLKLLNMSVRDQVELSVLDGSIIIKPYHPVKEKRQAADDLKALRRKAENFDYREEMNTYLDERYMHE